MSHLLTFGELFLSCRRQEDQNPDFGTTYTDFGARQYSPTLRSWMTPDPMSEKYYGTSPYAFCNNNPVNFVDPDGEHPVVVGAIIGGAISGTAAIIKGKSFTEVIAATVGGAVDGAISTAGFGIGGKVLSGIAGGGVGSLVEQSINMAFGNQEKINGFEIGVSATIGSATNGITELIGKEVNSIAKDILESPSARKAIEMDIKKNLNTSGKKATKRMIQKSVDGKVEESVKAASKTIDLSTNTIDYSLGFYNDILSDDEEQ